MLAMAAIKKLSITPGPAILYATIPATKYIPVPQHDPTPRDVRSSVVKHFWKKFQIESLRMIDISRSGYRCDTYS